MCTHICSLLIPKVTFTQRELRPLAGAESQSDKETRTTVYVMLKGLHCFILQKAQL